MYSREVANARSCKAKGRRRRGQARDNDTRSSAAQDSGAYVGPLLPLIRKFESQFAAMLFAAPARVRVVDGESIQDP